jgi:hypothetical protein
MSSGADLTGAVRDRMRADGVDLSQSVPVNDPGSLAQGTEQESTTTQASTPSAETLNTDVGATGGPPNTIPYSRFAEVNTRLQVLRPWEQVAAMGIEPDSAVRLASFEQAYMQDPAGTISAMIDQQDLPETQKTALKALLSQSDGALETESSDETVAKLPAEVMEAVGYVRELRDREQQADTNSRLDHMVRHWAQQDEQDGLSGVTERQRLLYIQSVAGSDQRFQTLEDMTDAARAQFLLDRDANLGSVVSQARGAGGPLAVPSGGLPPTQPVVPRTMAEARKLIEADIQAGRLPDLMPES